MLYLITVALLCQGIFGMLPKLTEEELSNLPPEYKLRFRSKPKVSSLPEHQTKAGYKYLYVDHRGHSHSSPQSTPTIKIAATHGVQQLALQKGAKIIGLMTRHMTSKLFNMIAQNGHGVGIFTRHEKVTAFPEFDEFKSPPECHNKCTGPVCSETCSNDGRKYEDIRGLTFNISVLVEDNILCNAYDEDLGLVNALVHEFAHQVYDYMPSEDKNRVLLSNLTFVSHDHRMDSLLNDIHVANI